MSTAISVSIVIVGWNSRTDLEKCLPSLVNTSYPAYEVIMVDNASTDGTAAWLTRHFPQVRLLRNAHNQGFARATNQGFAVATGDVLVGLNPDTTVTSTWLSALVEAVQQPGVGLATPRLMMMASPQHLNAYGNQVSITGLAFCQGVGDSPTKYQGTRAVAAISGAAFAITRTCYADIGGFDAGYFTYYEDTDLSWRARLAGYDIVAVGKSVVYHNYKHHITPSKMYWLERNRWATLLKHLTPATLIALAPMLLLGELLIWSFAVMDSSQMAMAKLKAMAWLFVHIPALLSQRRTLRLKRRRGDDAITEWFTPRVPIEQVSHGRFVLRAQQGLERCMAAWQSIMMVPSNHQ